jgi:hypothetical protein
MQTNSFERKLSIPYSDPAPSLGPGYFTSASGQEERRRHL